MMPSVATNTPSATKMKNRRQETER